LRFNLLDKVCVKIDVTDNLKSVDLESHDKDFAFLEFERDDAIKFEMGAHEFGVNRKLSTAAEVRIGE
jgi:hypothetical protein